MTRDELKHTIRAIAEEATPANFDLWPRIKQSIAPQKAKPRLGRNGMLVLAAAAVMIVLFFGIWLLRRTTSQITVGANPTETAVPTQTPTLSAADANSVPLKSFEGVIRYDFQSQTNQIIPMQAHVWYEAPYRWREEWYTSEKKTYDATVTQALKEGLKSTPIRAAGDPTFTAWEIRVSDESRTWDYQAMMGGVFSLPLDTPCYQISLSCINSITGQGETALKTLTQRLGMSASNVTPLGETSILDRTAYLFEIVGPQYPGSTGTVRTLVWVDKLTFMSLKQQTYDEKGAVITQWEYIQLKINGTMDKSLFKLTLPDAAWRNARPSANAGFWTDFAKTSGLAIFAPTPGTLDSAQLLFGAAKYDAIQGVMVQPAYAAQDPYGEPALAIYEFGEPFVMDKANALQGQSDATGTVTKVPLTQFGLDGSLWRAGDTLVFTAYVYGTQIIMRAKETATLTEERFTRIAQSLTYYPAKWAVNELDSAFSAIQKQAVGQVFQVKQLDSTPDSSGYPPLFQGYFIEGLPIRATQSHTITQRFYRDNKPEVAFVITQTVYAYPGFTPPPDAKTETIKGFDYAVSYSTLSYNCMFLRSGAITILIEAKPYSTLDGNVDLKLVAEHLVPVK